MSQIMWILQALAAVYNVDTAAVYKLANAIKSGKVDSKPIVVIVCGGNIATIESMANLKEKLNTSK